MKSAKKVEAVARAIWISDPRVNQVAWTDGDDQTKSMYRILASAALHVGDQFTDCNPGFQTQVDQPASG